MPKHQPYDPALAERVCAHIREGGSVNGLLSRPGMPAQSTLWRWMRRSPEFCAMFTQACEARAERARALGERDAGEGGRPSGYTPELAEEICALIAGGLAVSEMERWPGMPHRSTIFRWTKERSDFRRLYATACEARAETLGEEALRIADEALGQEWPGAEGRPEVSAREALAAARLRIDTIKWRVGRLQPKATGEADDGFISHEEGLDELD